MDIDTFYESIFGTKPVKLGTAYELIVAAVLKHLNRDAEVSHNVFLKSVHAGDNYQLDGLVKVANESIFVEGKDHSKSEKKVGRPDINKLAGAMLVLKDVDRGVVASATGFTGPAENCPIDLNSVNAKPIDLFLIRQSEESDEEGRIKTIVLTLNLIIPNFSSAQWEPILSEKAKGIIAGFGMKEGQAIPLALDAFYREDGSVIETVNNLTGKLMCDHETMLAEGSWEFEEQAHIYINESLVPIDSFGYKVPFSVSKVVNEINGGEPAVLVQAIDGSVDRLISKENLIKAHAEVIRDMGNKT